MPMKKVVRRKPAKKVAKKVVKRRVSPAQAAKKKIALLAKKYTLVKRAPVKRRVAKKPAQKTLRTVCLEGYKINKKGRCVKDKNYVVRLHTVPMYPVPVYSKPIGPKPKSVNEYSRSIGPKPKDVNEYSRAIGPSMRKSIPKPPVGPLRESQGIYFGKNRAAPRGFASMLRRAREGLKKPNQIVAQKQISIEKAKTILAKAGVAAKPANDILKALSKKLDAVPPPPPPAQGFKLFF